MTVPVPPGAGYGAQQLRPNGRVRAVLVTTSADMKSMPPTDAMVSSTEDLAPGPSPLALLRRASNDRRGGRFGADKAVVVEDTSSESEDEDARGPRRPLPAVAHPRHAWDAWQGAVRAARTRARAAAVAALRRHFVALQDAFLFWRARARATRRARSQADAMRRERSVALLQCAWDGWREYASLRAQKNQQKLVADLHRAHVVLRGCVHAWRDAAVMTQEERAQNAAAMGQRCRWLLARGLAGWGWYVEGRAYKRGIAEEARAYRREVVLTAAVREWARVAEEGRERAEAAWVAAGRAEQAGAMRRALRQWRAGAALEAKSRAVLAEADRCGLPRRFTLRRALVSWHAVARQATEHEARAWRERVLTAACLRTLRAYAVHRQRKREATEAAEGHARRSLLGKAWDALCWYREHRASRERAKVLADAHARSSALARAMRTWREVAEESLREAEHACVAEGFAELKTLGRAWGSWRDAVRESQWERAADAHYAGHLAGTAMAAWREWYAHKCLRFEQNRMARRRLFLATAGRAWRAWVGAVRDARERADALTGALAGVLARHRARAALGRWRGPFLQMARAKRARQMAAMAFWGRRVARAALGLWREVAGECAAERRAMERARAFHERSLAARAMAGLAEWRQSQQDERRRDESALRAAVRALRPLRLRHAWDALRCGYLAAVRERMREAAAEAMGDRVLCRWAWGRWRDRAAEAAAEAVACAAADRHCNTLLARRALRAWMEGARECAWERVVEAEANAHRGRVLMEKGLLALRWYRQYRHTKARRIDDARALHWDLARKEGFGVWLSATLTQAGAVTEADAAALGVPERLWGPLGMRPSGPLSPRVLGFLAMDARREAGEIASRERGNVGDGGGVGVGRTVGYEGVGDTAGAAGAWHDAAGSADGTGVVGCVGHADGWGGEGRWRRGRARAEAQTTRNPHWEREGLSQQGESMNEQGELASPQAECTSQQGVSMTSQPSSTQRGVAESLPSADAGVGAAAAGEVSHKGASVVATPMGSPTKRGWGVGSGGGVGGGGATPPTVPQTVARVARGAVAGSSEGGGEGVAREGGADSSEGGGAAEQGAAVAGARESGGGVEGEGEWCRVVMAARKGSPSRVGVSIIAGRGAVDAEPCSDLRGDDAEPGQEMGVARAQVAGDRMGADAWPSAIPAIAGRPALPAPAPVVANSDRRSMDLGSLATRLTEAVARTASALAVNASPQRCDAVRLSAPGPLGDVAGSDRAGDVHGGWGSDKDRGDNKGASGNGGGSARNDKASALRSIGDSTQRLQPRDASWLDRVLASLSVDAAAAESGAGRGMAKQGVSGEASMRGAVRGTARGSAGEQTGSGKARGVVATRPSDAAMAALSAVLLSELASIHGALREYAAAEVADAVGGGEGARGERAERLRPRAEAAVRRLRELRATMEALEGVT